QRRLLFRVRVLSPERLDRPARRHGDLAGLAVALRGVVVARADLHGTAPRPALVARVRDVELDVAVAETAVAVNGPEDVHPAEVRAICTVVDGDPLVVVEVRLVVGVRG